MTEVVICCGVGGTGKTTASAAMAVAFATAGKRVVVLTIDPARRLADALSIREIGNAPTRVEIPGVEGSLHALMLDRKSTWDDIVRRFSPSDAAADRLLANRYYRAVSTRLTGSHEYMAIEKLHELVEADRWDVVVVDTPPAQHVVDFFRAPDRIRRVFDRSVLSAFTKEQPGLLGRATSRVATLLQRLAGERVMRDIAEFFGLMSELSGGFRDRARTIGELLANTERTSYYLITDARAPERNNLLDFLQEIRERRMHFAGFVVNRVAMRPDPSRDHELPGHLPMEEWPRWRGALTHLVSEAVARADRQEQAVERLIRAAGGAPAWRIPEVPGGVGDLDGLRSMAAHLPPLA